MKAFRSVRVAGFVVLVLAAPTIWAYPVSGRFNLDSLVDGSDAVCVVEVNTIKDTGIVESYPWGTSQLRARKSYANCLVTAVYKGTIAPGTTIHIAFFDARDEGVLLPGIRVGATVLVFLDRNNKGDWVFSDTSEDGWWGQLGVPPTRPLVGMGTEPRAAIVAEFQEMVRSGERDFVLSGLPLCADSQIDVPLELLVDLSTRSEQEIRVAAITQRLRQADHSVHKEILTFLVAPSQTLRTAPWVGRLFRELANHPVPGDLSVLNKLLLTDRFCGGAVRVLMERQDPSSVPYLIRAMRLPPVHPGWQKDIGGWQKHFRDLCHTALSRIVDGGPAYSLFDQDPEQCIQQWEHWYATEGRHLYPDPEK